MTISLEPTHEQAEAFFYHLLTHGWLPYDESEKHLYAENDALRNLAYYLARAGAWGLECVFVRYTGACKVYAIRPRIHSNGWILEVNGKTVPRVDYFWSEYEPWHGLPQ